MIRLKNFLLHPYLLIATAMVLAALCFGFATINSYYEGAVYLQYGKLFFDSQIPESMGMRDPGYPLVVALTGTMHLDSLNYLLFAQALMSAGIIALVYYALAPLSRRLAVMSGWAALLSAIGFQYQNFLFNDHVYAFAFSLTSALGIRAALSRRVRDCYWMLAAFAFLSLMRITYYTALLPVGLIITWCWAVNRRHTRHLLLYVLCVGLALGMNYFLREARFDRPQETKSTRIFSQLSYEMFHSLYRSAGDTPAFFPEDGPITRDFLEFVRRNLVLYYEGEIADPELALRHIFDHPSYGNSQNIRHHYYSSPNGQHKVPQLALEQVRAHPELIYYIFRQAFMDSGFVEFHRQIGKSVASGMFFHEYPLQYRIAFQPWYKLDEIAPEQTGLPPNIKHEIQASKDYIIPRNPNYWKLHDIYENYYVALCQFSTCLIGVAATLLAVAALLRRDFYRQSAIAFVVVNSFYWPPTLLTAIMVPMTYRYHVETALWLIVAGCLAVKVIADLAKKSSAVTHA